MEEVTLWQGARSQITNLGKFFLAALVATGIVIAGIVSLMPLLWILCVIPVIYMLWVWIATKAESFTLTSERLRMKKGVFNQIFEEVELYRVKDVSHSRNVLQRMLGLGTIALLTSDRGQENIVIESVRASDELREHLRQQVELIRDRKRVREVDFQEENHPAES